MVIQSPSQVLCHSDCTLTGAAWEEVTLSQSALKTTPHPHRKKPKTNQNNQQHEEPTKTHFSVTFSTLNVPLAK